MIRGELDRGKDRDYYHLQGNIPLEIDSCVPVEHRDRAENSDDDRGDVSLRMGPIDNP
jgi:hypothetical protein